MSKKTPKETVTDHQLIAEEESTFVINQQEKKKPSRKNDFRSHSRLRGYKRRQRVREREGETERERERANPSSSQYMHPGFPCHTLSFSLSLSLSLSLSFSLFALLHDEDTMCLNALPYQHCPFFANCMFQPIDRSFENIVRFRPLATSCCWCLEHRQEHTQTTW